MKFRFGALRAPDEVPPAGTVAPPATPPAPPPVAPPAPPSLAATPPAPAPREPGSPAWLPARLNEERRKTINEVVQRLGIKVGKGDDTDVKIKEAIEKLNAGKEKRKALRERNEKLEGEVVKLASLTATIKIFAESEMAGLSEQQRSAVKTVAGDDPSKQLETIAGYRLAGMIPVAPSAPTAPTTPPAATPPATAPAAPPAAPPAPASAPPAAPAPLPAPVTSAPPVPGPVAGDPPGTVDLVAEVTRLGKSSDARDRMRARMLVLQNPSKYADAMKARQGTAGA